MRITIHFDFKPEVTVSNCEVTLVTLKRGYVYIKTTEESVWEMLFAGMAVSQPGRGKEMILRLYNDGTCSIEEQKDGYYKVTGMSAIEVSEKEFND